MSSVFPNVIDYFIFKHFQGTETYFSQKNISEYVLQEENLNFGLMKYCYVPPN